MPRKRKLPELSEDATATISSGHDVIKKQKTPVQDDTPAQAFKPKPRPRSSHNSNANQSTTSTSNPNSLNSLKTRIRNLKRLLEHTDHDRGYKMPADVRVVRERELATCEHDLAEKTSAAKDSKHKQKMIGRYHQVRFFERQKATRILKKLRKEAEAATTPAEKREAFRKIHIAEVDLNYTLFYPLMRPYSALFPKTQSNEPATRSHSTPEFEGYSAGEEEMGDAGIQNAAPATKGDHTMWRAVERAMELGTLETLRNSEPSERHPHTKKQPQAMKKESDQTRKHVQKEKGQDRQGTSAKSTSARSTVGVSDDEGSDGGFFE